MEAYHGKEEIKQKYLDRVLAHREADEIIKGQYWENGKGCAVGCTIHDSSHASYETELGLPEWLALLEDKLFEDMPNEDAKLFPEKFLLAIPIGAKNFDLVKWKFLRFVLDEQVVLADGLKIDDSLKEQVIEAIVGVLEVINHAIETGFWDVEKALEKRKIAGAAAYAAADAAYADAADAAYAAAAYAAYADAAAYAADADADAAYAANAADAAAYAAYADAADAAADAAAADAAYAADAAAYAAYAAADARQDACKRYADELLRLLGEMS